MMKQPSYVKVLIVDDFALDVHYITRQLQSKCVHEIAPVKYDILSAATGRDGLMQMHEFQPDCILLDYGLPDMNGLEFIDTLVQIRGELDVPIVMLTGQGDEQIAVNAMKRGIHDYLIKGNFNAGQLTWTICSALEKAKLQTELASKHEELEMFAARMAHDILGPLANLSLYAEYLEDQATDPVEVPPDNEQKIGHHDNPLQSIMASVDHIADMVEAFRDYAHVGRTDVNFSKVNLDTIIDHILLILRADINKVGAEILVDPLPTVVGDSTGLGQLLQNLFSNALKYCSETPRIHVSAIRCGSKWQISVSDNGIGINERDVPQDEIFEPFVRQHTRAQYPGSGIGLATCRKIVEQHGGEIWYTSTAKQGTTFYFTLEQELEVTSQPLTDHVVENLAHIDHRYIPDDAGEEAYKLAGWPKSKAQQSMGTLLPNKHADSHTTYYH